MVTRLVHPLLVWLAFAGFVLQSACVGVPFGHGLCIGCDREGSAGWTISEPCVPGVRDCCADEHHEGESAECLSGPAVHDPADCGCIDVPLMGGMTAFVSAPVRIDVAASQLFDHVLPVPVFLADQHRFGIQDLTCWARAGPMWWDGSPPRLLTPLARWTVLTV
ncbi:MAG: hypothetical protein AABZ53_05825 [Planctomycetota bacterium]